MALRPIRLPHQGQIAGQAAASRLRMQGIQNRSAGIARGVAGLTRGFDNRRQQEQFDEQMEFRKAESAKQYGLQEQRLAIARSQMQTSNWAQAVNMAMTNRTIAEQELARAQQGNDMAAIDVAQRNYEKANAGFQHAQETFQASIARTADQFRSVGSSAGEDCGPGG